MEDTTFISQFYLGQVVKLQFTKAQEPLTTTITGVHFFEGKVKYDLVIWLEDNTTTRIYNVDSCFVTI